ncbi:MAG: type II CRISPR-associated endonuclease Cas1 [Tissierellales bacterium]|nr:type II CRISPR-associated endonuclease Cas1 [Tissierellales bacterium]MBN2828046.1 type II CRISPR-associated endonuclease Cas1 [Tissierellales bacterium]
MSFRVILIENGGDLRYKLDNLLITIDGKETWVPFADISTIVVDNLNISITTRVLNAIAEENICLIVCDYDHLPTGIYYAYCNHSRASKIIGYQIDMDQITKDELWQEIVRSKILNQYRVLKILGFEEGANKILDYWQNVQIGDASNREAHAAKVYFNQLMGKSFSRGDDNILMNSGLDYGYTIIRSYLARLCVGYGLNTMLGIHHKNEYNKFCLVDDLIEPLRPIVDLFVYQIMKDGKYFTKEHRHKLIDIVNHKIIYKEKNQFLGNAIDEYICCFTNAIKNQCFSEIEYFDVNNYLGER